MDTNPPGNDALNAAQRAIVAECDALRDMLLAKNRRYGNSALDPTRVFAKATPLAQIAVRLDDKLSRIQNMGGLEAVLGAHAPDGEDTIQDLLGYLILARVAVRLAAPSGKCATEKVTTLAGLERMPISPTKTVLLGHQEKRIADMADRICAQEAGVPGTHTRSPPPSPPPVVPLEPDYLLKSK